MARSIKKNFLYNVLLNITSVILKLFYLKMSGLLMTKNVYCCKACIQSSVPLVNAVMGLNL